MFQLRRHSLPRAAGAHRADDAQSLQADDVIAVHVQRTRLPRQETDEDERKDEDDSAQATGSAHRRGPVLCRSTGNVHDL